MNAAPLTRPAVAYILARMAGKAECESEIAALRVAARTVLKRHFDTAVNRLRRKERKLAARALPPFCQSSAKTAPGCQGLATDEPTQPTT